MSDMKPVFGLNPAMLGKPLPMRPGPAAFGPLRFTAGGNEVVRIEGDGSVFWKGRRISDGDDASFREMMRELHQIMCRP